METNTRLLLKLGIKTENNPTIPQDSTCSKERETQTENRKSAVLHDCALNIYTGELLRNSPKFLKV